MLSLTLGAFSMGRSRTLDAIAAAAQAEPPSRVDALLASRRGHDSRRRGGRAFCFSPGTDEAHVERLLAAVAPDAKSAVAAFEAGGRWTSTATDGFGLRQGDPTTLTWSIVPDGTTIRGAFGAQTGGSDLQAFLDGIYGSRANWLPILTRVFDRWGELCGVTYVYEPNDDGVQLATASGRLGLRGDVRIGGLSIDGNFGLLAFNGFPNDGDMVLDTSDAYFRNTGLSSRRLRNVVAHEHGHGLALDHVCPQDGTKLMEPSATLGFDGPQHDDILGAQRLYGDAREPNDLRAAATDLGSPSRVVVERVSIDDDTDTDWYRFRGTAGDFVDVTLQPVGRRYREGPQSFDGSCGNGTILDTTQLVDLNLALFGPTGNLLTSADATGRGESEELVDEPLSEGAGDYFLRVRGGGENDAQLYELDLRVAQRGEKPVAVDDDATTFEVLPVTITVLDNDTGLADVPIDVRVHTKPAAGRVRRVGDALVYVPDRGFVGEDSFTYRVRDVNTQVAFAEARVTVNAVDRAGDLRGDADEDLYPDELERALGSDPDDGADRPGPVLTQGVGALVVRRLQLRLADRETPKDRLTFRGEVVLEPGTELSGRELVVHVGGVTRSFVLDERGRGETEDATIRVRAKRRRGEVVGGATRFDLVVRRANLAASFTDEGLLLDRRHGKEPRAISVYVLLDGEPTAATVPLSYSVQGRRRGSARSVRAR